MKPEQLRSGFPPGGQAYCLGKGCGKRVLVAGITQAKDRTGRSRIMGFCPKGHKVTCWGRAK